MIELKNKGELLTYVGTLGLNEMVRTVRHGSARRYQVGNYIFQVDVEGTERACRPTYTWQKAASADKRTELRDCRDDVQYSS